MRVVPPPLVHFLWCPWQFIFSKYFKVLTPRLPRPYPQPRISSGGAGVGWRDREGGEGVFLALLLLIPPWRHNLSITHWLWFILRYSQIFFLEMLQVHRLSFVLFAFVCQYWYTVKQFIINMWKTRPRATECTCLYLSISLYLFFCLFIVLPILCVIVSILYLDNNSSYLTLTL